MGETQSRAESKHEQPKYHGVWSQVQGGGVYPTWMTLTPHSTNISRLVGFQPAYLLPTSLLSVLVPGTFPSGASLGNVVPFGFRCECVIRLLPTRSRCFLLWWVSKPVAYRGLRSLQRPQLFLSIHPCCQCSEAVFVSKTLSK